jgi:hypothetical protein
VLHKAVYAETGEEIMVSGAYFVRHTKSVLVRREDMERLWAEDRVAVHFPGDTANSVRDSESLDPDRYNKRDEKGAIGAFRELAEHGGYVWAQSYVSDKAKVGYVRGIREGGRGVEMDKRARWELRGRTYEGREDGDPATLKTLRIEGVGPVGIVKVGKGEQMDLRARRPQRSATSRWKVGDRLREVAEGKPRKAAFSSLSPAEQEAACAEFLREQHPRRSDLPVLKRLLLPVGRGLEDVDIYGIAEDGALVYAQVTNHRVGKKPATEKAKRLGAYRSAYADRETGADERGTGVYLTFFGVGDGASEVRDVAVVSVDKEVEPWILSDPEHRRGFFGRA